jgi:hypothetical protein
MGVAYMKRVYINEYEVNIENKAWEYKDELSSSGNGDSVIIPVNVANIAISYEVDSGEGKIQYTMSTIEEIEAGSALWHNWDSGDVTSNSEEFFKPVSAVRQVNASGTTTMRIRAQ